MVQHCMFILRFSRNMPPNAILSQGNFYLFFVSCSPAGGCFLYKHINIGRFDFITGG